MLITMQCQLMSALMDLLNNVWVLFYTVSNQKERGTYILVCEHIEQARRILSMWTIVKCQRDLRAGRIAVEQDLRITALCKIIETLEHFSIIIARHGKWQIESPPGFIRRAKDRTARAWLNRLCDHEQT